MSEEKNRANKSKIDALDDGEVYILMGALDMKTQDGVDQYLQDEVFHKIVAKIAEDNDQEVIFTAHRQAAVTVDQGEHVELKMKYSDEFKGAINFQQIYGWQLKLLSENGSFYEEEEPDNKVVGMDLD